MFCPKCGSQIPEGSKFCTHCGTSTAQSGANAPTGMNYGAQTQEYEYPMNWYKFLIYFALFASALLNVISGIMTMVGSQYQGLADYVYLYFGGGLKALDIIMGIIQIAIAALAILTRFSLAKFEAKGPKLVMLLYLVNAVVSLFYVVVASAITGMNLFDASTIISIIVSIAMLVANRVYFTKRQSLFVN